MTIACTLPTWPTHLDVHLSATPCSMATRDLDDATCGAAVAAGDLRLEILLTQNIGFLYPDA